MHIFASMLAKNAKSTPPKFFSNNFDMDFKKAEFYADFISVEKL